MKTYQKGVLFVIGYLFFYFICINSCEENANDYTEEATVVSFIKKENYNGRMHGGYYYPQVLVVYNKDSYYFAKVEWNKFINLSIGEKVNAKFVFEDIYDENIDSTLDKILTEEHLKLLEDKIGNNLSGFKVLTEKKIIGQKLVSVEIYNNLNRYMSMDKIYLYGFIFVNMALIVFHKEVQSNVGNFKNKIKHKS